MNTATQRPGRIARAALALGTTFVMAASLVMFTAGPSTAAEPLPDGKTSITAAGSCWEAKQNYPSSTDGVYWLLTPALKAPTQFFCDMTTDGGGWASSGGVARGGRTTTTGCAPPESSETPSPAPNAFLVAQLPALTVDGLLNNGAVSASAGWRATAQGDEHDGHLLAGGTVRDAETRPLGLDIPRRAPRRQLELRRNRRFGRHHEQLRQRLPVPPRGHERQGGAGMGRRLRVRLPVAGRTRPRRSCLRRTSRAGNATALHAGVPAAATAHLADDLPGHPRCRSSAQTLRDMPESDARPTVWGVTGQANGIDGELNTEVSAFGQVGNTVYVGGNFQYVQRTLTSTGAIRSNSSSSPASTSTRANSHRFQPVLNDQVKAIIGLPDGRLAVGGQFSRSTASRAWPRRARPSDRTNGGRLAGRCREPNGGEPVQVRGLSMRALALRVGLVHTPRRLERRHVEFVERRTHQPPSGRPRHQTGTPTSMARAWVWKQRPTEPEPILAGYFRQSGVDADPERGSVPVRHRSAPVTPLLGAPIFSKPWHGLTGISGSSASPRSASRVYIGGSEHSLSATTAARSQSERQHHEVGRRLPSRRSQQRHHLRRLPLRGLQLSGRLHLERHRHELDAGRQHQPVRRVGCRDRHVHRRFQPDHPGTSRLRRVGAVPGLHRDALGGRRLRLLDTRRTDQPVVGRLHPLRHA